MIYPEKCGDLVSPNFYGIEVFPSSYIIPTPLFASVLGDLPLEIQAQGGAEINLEANFLESTLEPHRAGR